jgi:hypothetical protein
VAYENHKVFGLQNHKAVQMYQVKYWIQTLGRQHYTILKQSGKIQS